MPTKFIPFTAEPSINQGQNLSGAGLTANLMPDIVNGYFEDYKTAAEEIRQLKFTMRPQTIDSSLTLNTSNADNVINGMISSLDRTRLFYVLTGTGGPLFRTLTSAATTSPATGPGAGWSNTTGYKWDYLDGISYGANNYFVVTDFTKGALISSPAGVWTWTDIAAAVYTGLTTKTNILPMDGYLFCGDGATNRIYNCDLNTPATWTATSFVTSADSPGQLLWLGRIRNYLIAFKQYSIEFWEDVGNPTPGSPLESQKQLNRKIGLYSTSSVQEVSDGLIFAGLNQGGKISMYKIDRETLSIKVIANKMMEWSLANENLIPVYFSTYLTYPKQSAYLGASQVINFKDKEFYCITLAGPSANSCTFVYDNELEIWTRWYTNTNQHATTNDGYYLPSQCVSLKLSSTYIGPIFAKNYGGAGTTFATKLQRYLVFNELSFGERIGFGFTSDFIDLGSNKRKFQDSVELLYEFNTGFDPSLGSTIAQVDYFYKDKSFSTYPSITTKSTSLKTSGQDRAIFRRGGSFRSRAHSFMFNSDVPSNTGPPPNITIFGFFIVYNEGETDQS